MGVPLPRQLLGAAAIGCSFGSPGAWARLVVSFASPTCPVLENVRNRLLYVSPARPSCLVLPLIVHSAGLRQRNTDAEYHNTWSIRSRKG